MPERDEELNNAADPAANPSQPQQPDNSLGDTSAEEAAPTVPRYETASDSVPSMPPAATLDDEVVRDDDTTATSDVDSDATIAADIDSLADNDDPEAVADSDDADADSDDLDEPRRPRMGVLIAGVLLLAIIGGGVGLLVYNWRTGRFGGGSDQTIARVGDVNISRGEFTRNWTDGQDAQAVLDQLIDFELVVQAARSEGAPVDTAAIDTQIQNLKTQHGNDAAQFETFLKQNNIASEATLRGLIERQQLVEAMVLKHTTVEQARASHILLAADTPDAVSKRKSEAEDLLKQLQGGADFKKLAAEKSEDPGSKVKGGDLGWAPRGVFVPEFDEAVFSMKPGELRLVQSQFGWHIIKLDNAPEVRGLESQDYFQTPPVMDAFNKTFLPWVKGLRTDADAKGTVTILVQPTELVPTAGPTAPPVADPNAPAPGGAAPGAPAEATPLVEPTTAP